MNLNILNYLDPITVGCSLLSFVKYWGRVFFLLGLVV